MSRKDPWLIRSIVFPVVDMLLIITSLEVSSFFPCHELWRCLTQKRSISNLFLFLVTFWVTWHSHRGPLYSPSIQKTWWHVFYRSSICSCLYALFISSALVAVTNVSSFNQQSLNLIKFFIGGESNIEAYIVCFRIFYNNDLYYILDGACLLGIYCKCRH